MEFRPNAFKVTLLFPMHDNAGEPFAESVWDWWRAEFTRIIPGYTELGPVAGWWQGQTDRHRMVYVIVGADEDEKIEELRGFVSLARSRFEQEAMYFEIQAVQYEQL